MSASEAKAAANIHPPLQMVEYVCSCGAKYEIQSTLRQSSLHVEVCAACHPFYTGEQKLIDTAGRVENFRRRYEKKAAPAKTASAPKAKSAAEAKPKKKAAAKKTDDSSNK